MVKMRVFRVGMFVILFCLMFCINSCDDGEKGKSLIAVYQDSNIIEHSTGFYDFGSFDFGETCPVTTFIIKNEGDDELQLTGTPKIEVSGSGAASFIVDDSKTSSSLVPNVSTTFTIKFDTTIYGLKTAVVKISNDTADTNPYIFTITAESYTMYKWTRAIVSDTMKCTTAINTDLLGNVYISGLYCNPVDFGADFGVTDVKTCDMAALFITKILADGSYGWTRQLINRNATMIHSIAIDSKGNIYYAGSFNGTINFGEDFGVSDIHSTQETFSSDIFIMKITSNGDYVWTKVFGNTERNNCCDIVCDSDDNVYFVSGFKGSIDFGAPFGVSDIITAIDDADSAITKIDSSGNYLWTLHFGSNGVIGSAFLALDELNNLYLAGSFYGSVNFGECFGVTDIKNSSDHSDIFVTKIMHDHKYGWTKRIGGVDRIESSSMTLDSLNNIYITGRFEKSVNFGEDFGVTDIRTPVPAAIPDPYDNNCDVFLMKINADSSYGWVKHFGNDVDESRCAAVIDSNDNIYFAGDFYSTLDFGKDFGVSDVFQISDKHNRLFLTKMKSDGSYFWTKCVGDSNGDLRFKSMSINPDNNIYIGGDFSGTIDFAKPFSTSDVKNTPNRPEDLFILKLKE